MFLLLPKLVFTFQLPEKNVKCDISKTIPIITSLFLKKLQGMAAVTFFQVISMNFFKNKYLGRFKKKMN